MVIVKKLVVGDLNTNCYIVSDDLSNNSLIIDPGDDFQKINSYVSENNLIVKAVLITHGHFDHIGACYYLKNKGIPIYIHSLDADKCSDNDLNLSNSFSNIKTQTFVPDVLLFGDSFDFKIDTFNIKMIHTPGHSKGSCVYIIDRYIFSGDTIFDNGYGRTDFYDGSMIELRNSIRKISSYVNNGLILCAGH